MELFSRRTRTAAPLHSVVGRNPPQPLNTSEMTPCYMHQACCYYCMRGKATAQQCSRNWRPLPCRTVLCTAKRGGLAWRSGRLPTSFSNGPPSQRYRIPLPMGSSTYSIHDCGTVLSLFETVHCPVLCARRIGRSGSLKYSTVRHGDCDVRAQ